MKQFNLLVSIFMILTASVVSLQAQQICGTPDLDVLTQRLLDNKERLAQNEVRFRQETAYVPIKFHLVARNDGTGRVQEEDVYKGLCRLNEAYENIGLQFYIKDNEFNYIDNTAAYENPQVGMLILSFHKDGAAMNIFITGGAGSGPGGTTLGYYSPSDDWIIIRKDQLIDPATMPHEVGHFFSLLHTFNGWECEPYNSSQHGNPVNLSLAPCNSSQPPFGAVQVELVDRSNCDNSGDFLCGTPPDYNFGLGYNSCDYTPEIKDGNGEVIDPMEDNYMSYFLLCTEYEFTQDQIDVILADYESPDRDYLRTAYEPMVIEDPTVNFISPQDGEVTAYQDYVEFDWEDVPGASHYILEINFFFPSFSDPTYRFIVEGESRFELEDDFGAGSTYHYRITPYNDYNTCFSDLRSNSVEFTTGSGFVATEDISRELSWEVFPNPIEQIDDLTIRIQSKRSDRAKLQIINAHGAVTIEREIQLRRGEQVIEWSNGMDLPRGIYLLRLETEKEEATQTILIQ